MLDFVRMDCPRSIQIPKSVHAHTHFTINPTSSPINQTIWQHSSGNAYKAIPLLINSPLCVDLVQKKHTSLLLRYKPMKCYYCYPVQKYIESLLLASLIYLVSELSGRDQIMIYYTRKLRSWEPHMIPECWSGDPPKIQTINFFFGSKHTVNHCGSLILFKILFLAHLVAHLPLQVKPHNLKKTVFRKLVSYFISE